MALLWSDGMDARSVGAGGTSGGGTAARNDILQKYIVPVGSGGGIGSVSQDVWTVDTGTPVSANGRSMVMGAVSTGLEQSNVTADLGAQTGVIRAQFYARLLYVGSNMVYDTVNFTTAYDSTFRDRYFISFSSNIHPASSSPFSDLVAMPDNHMILAFSASKMGVKWSGNTSAILTNVSTVVGTWYHYEIEFKFDGASTYFKVWRDSELIFNATGVGSAAGTSIRYFNMHFGNSVKNYRFQYDDLVIWNDAGDGLKGRLTAPLCIRTVFPQAAGSFSDGTPTSGFNFECVDEQDPNTSDYVSMAVEGMKDTYDFAAVSSEVTEIQTVTLNVLSRSVGTTTNTFRMVAKSGSYLTYSPPVGVPAVSTFGVRQIDIPLDPNTGLKWTESGINAAEFGYELNGTL